jgi:hypothetical protein
MNRMHRPGRWAAGLTGAVAALGAAAVLGTTVAGAPSGQRAASTQAAASSAGHRIALTSSQSCPASAQGILPLRRDSVAKAADRALVFDRQPPGVKPGTEVMASDRSAFGGARGAEVAFLCGAKVARRTVVVQLLFPWLLPSASLSQGVVFVGRFRGGYRVWFVAH